MNYNELSLEDLKKVSGAVMAGPDGRGCTDRWQLIWDQIFKGSGSSQLPDVSPSGSLD